MGGLTQDDSLFPRVISSTVFVCKTELLVALQDLKLGFVIIIFG